MNYRKRIVDKELSTRLLSSGAVVIEGPKACGKTETARQQARSEVQLDVDENARRAVAVDPGLILDGDTPRLMDEWQVEPAIWNHIRREVDNRRKPGQFILTGSSIPADTITRHSGAGRLTRLRMRPMSSFETGLSTGFVSMKDLLDGVVKPCSSPEINIRELAVAISRGGWPGSLDMDDEQAIGSVRDYLEEIRRVDVSEVGTHQHRPVKVGRFLRSIARNLSTMASASTLRRDMGTEGDPLSRDTINEYMNALERLMIVEDQPAWSTHLRSKSTLRSSEKRHFVDPSLAVAALRATPDRLLKDLEYFGFLFESLVVRDLRVYAQANDASVFHYRDNTGLEVDTVVEAADGRWVAFEVKLGAGRIEDAIANLQKLEDRVDTESRGKPAVLGVITNSGYSYLRDDGIAVLSIGALGP